MAFLKKITIKNYRCFKNEISIDLEQASYIIGPNNSGKSAVLSAIRCFFDPRLFSKTDINKTALAAKKGSSNKAEIAIEFDLDEVKGQARQDRLRSKYGDRLTLTKTFTYREITDTTVVKCKINSERYVDWESIENDVQHIHNAVSISFIHPQQGEELLRKAQDKFKQRLFHNWGRHASLSSQLSDLQEKWNELRTAANSYLSAALTERLKKIWPTSVTKVELPEKIKDFVAVSDISFRSFSSSPSISLTQQGTGAQSLILYHTHYLLDSDRSLHQGFYVPVWLIEEPESFLHTDIAIQLGSLLASSEWLGSIQILATTHSPIILASSRNSKDRASWTTLEAHMLKATKKVTNIIDADIKVIGRMLGDPNFDAYFVASQPGPLIIIEDSRKETKDAFEQVGISITKALHGSGEIKNYIEIYRSMPQIIQETMIFILDHDKGISDFKDLLTVKSLRDEKEGYSLYAIEDKIFIVLLPQGLAIEDMYDEFDEELEQCISDMFESDYSLKRNIQTNLSRIVSEVRKSRKPRNHSEAKERIKKHQDVKDRFWSKIIDENYKFSSKHVKALKYLIDKSNT